MSPPLETIPFRVFEKQVRSHCKMSTSIITQSRIEQQTQNIKNNTRRKKQRLGGGASVNKHSTAQEHQKTLS